MRILDLAKELGVSLDRLVKWSLRANLPYKNAEDEVSGEHEKRIRQAFTQNLPTRRKGEGADPSLDRLLAEAVDPGILETDTDLPDTIEELEALERELLRSPPEMVAPHHAGGESRPARSPLSRVLSRYGISGKSVLKKLRKLLPDDTARLLNQQDLSEEQAATLAAEIESRAVFFCDHPYCAKALERRHSPEMLVPVRDSSFCSLCKGSATRRALEETAEVCVESGVRRILVVGGMPSSQKEIRENTPLGVTFRLVEGDRSHQRQRIQADLRWCDLAVIWGSTILSHSLSGGYTRRKSAQGPFIIRVNRRSVEALCAEVIRHLKR